jgi:hypothetical protein
MAIDVAVEEVASNLEEIAEATRRINTNSVGFFLGGVGVGAVIGFYFGYKFNREKIKAEVFKQSEEEVAKIREVYQQKTLAAQPKPDLDEAARIARDEAMAEAGYSSEERDEHLGRPLRAPVPVFDPRSADAVSERPTWNYAEELKGRLDGEPYVVHQDEYMQSTTGYPKVNYTYYAIDDVLVDDANDNPLPHADIIVGLNNLQFGHGTDDDDVVFVRNDERQLEMEICRINKSYEEEVLGVENSEIHDNTDND